MGGYRYVYYNRKNNRIANTAHGNGSPRAPRARWKCRNVTVPGGYQFDHGADPIPPAQNGPKKRAVDCYLQLSSAT